MTLEGRALPGSWSREEVESIVSDYFEMLSAELRGEPFVKAEHRRRLRPLLKGRSEAAIERKHGNISAILLELDYPYVQGYKPYSNYQQLLFDVVQERLSRANHLDGPIRACNEAEIVVPEFDDILRALVDPPEPKSPAGRVAESGAPYRPTRRPPNYLELERRNSALGRAGEEFVLAFERARLMRAGREDLAAAVEHVASTRSDGEGFDVLSFDESGRDQYVEVKTTKYGAQTPFFVTQNEVGVSEKNADRYYLYRVFSFRQSPKLFVRRGAIARCFQLQPTQYRASVS